ncbi:MAG: peroxiredoxin family protein [Chloroflexales bacterium]|nr:peroxiredoxin family protein [Chloroflexales bacterium]
MREAHSQFTQRNVALLVVSSTEMEMTSYVAEVLRAPYPILSDGQWSVFERYGMGSVMGVPLPGTFVIDSNGIIRWSWAAPLAVAFTPPSPAKILSVIDQL